MTTDVATPDMGSTTISVPDDLADELYARKGRGESYADVIYRLLEQVDASDAPRGSEGDAVEMDHMDDGRDRDAPVAESAPGEITLESIDVPGSGEKAVSRREAVGGVLEYIQEHGEATPAGLKENVYPDHEAGYTAGEDPARSWWKNCVYPALREIADRDDRLEKADQTGRWSWRGE